jgi:hypothetical protein
MYIRLKVVRSFYGSYSSGRYIHQAALIKLPRCLLLHDESFTQDYLTRILYCSCRSHLMTTKFTIYDLQPRHEGAKTPKRGLSCWIANKQVSPHISSGDVGVGEVSYAHNLKKSKGNQENYSEVFSIVPMRLL